MSEKRPQTPEQKEARRLAMIRFREANPNYAAEWRAKNRERLNAVAAAREKERRATDPEYVERVRAEMRDFHWRHRDRRLAVRKAKWEEIRDHSNAKRRAHHAANREQANAKRKENAAMRRQLYPWEKLLRGAAGRAAKSGVEFTLTREWAQARWTGFCEVSGLPFLVKDIDRPGPKFFSPSIDQIRPKGGYTPDNCRFVLWAVNAFKQDATDAEMMLVAKAIVEKNSL